jgi:hypothetical protein
MAEQFKVGDVVKLKSGGPKITIYEISHEGLGGQGGDESMVRLVRRHDAKTGFVSTSVVGGRHLKGIKYWPNKEGTICLMNPS